jgi:4'-phosphopantetheinyl transferase
MITVYNTKVSPFWKEDTFWAIEKLDQKRKERLARLTDQRMKEKCLFTGVFLHDGLCRALSMDGDTAPAFRLSYGLYGKPFLTDYPSLFFNLSHSGEYVCLAVGNVPLGIDIQVYTRMKEGLAKRFFTEEDIRRLERCGEAEREKLFFRMWSIKESYIKLTGKGMSQGLSSFEIDWDSHSLWVDKESPAAFFTEKDRKGCACSLCTREREQEIQWIDIEDYPAWRKEMAMLSAWKGKE